MSTTMGMSTSKSRVDVGKDTSKPKSSKVISDSAHGASMQARGTPKGWVNYGHGVTTKSGLRTETYPKGKSHTQANMNPKGPKPEKW